MADALSARYRGGAGAGNRGCVGVRRSSACDARGRSGGVRLLQRAPPPARSCRRHLRRSSGAAGRARRRRPGGPGGLFHYGFAGHERRPHARSAATRRSAVGTIPELTGGGRAGSLLGRPMLLPAPLRRVYTLFQESVEAWTEDYAPSMGAALSYYTLFSIAPLLLIVIGFAGLVFGPEAARGEIFGQLRGLMGDQGAAAVEHLLQSADKPQGGTIATVTGIVMLLLGATTVFGELQNALDRIWRAPARKKASGWWNLLRSRVLSFGMILGISFLLMVSLVMSAL